MIGISLLPSYVIYINMLKFDKLTKSYGNFKALDDVSFSVEKGSITGFLGPNGAGKTTTMRIATGVLESEKGKILYDKKPLKLNFKEIISDIGYLPENNPLYTNLRVDEFLIFTAQMKENFDRDEIISIIKKCGLNEVVDKEIETLSKGFKQRVGLAKALIGSPKFLILDEPTEGLDPNQKEVILNLIKSFAKDKTIIFSSHVLSEVTKIADNIVIINKGKIIAEGDSDKLVKSHFKTALIELKTNAKYRELKSELKNIKNIIDINRIKSAKRKFNTYEINCSKPEKTAVEIFDTIVDNEWKLSKLNTKSLGLEELFKDLTKNE